MDNGLVCYDSGIIGFGNILGCSMTCSMWILTSLEKVRIYIKLYRREKDNRPGEWEFRWSDAGDRWKCDVEQTQGAESVITEVEWTELVRPKKGLRIHMIIFFWSYARASSWSKTVDIIYEIFVYHSSLWRLQNFV